jgi:hypothetical protein
MHFSNSGWQKYPTPSLPTFTMCIPMSSFRPDDSTRLEHCTKSITPAECLGRIRIGQGRIGEAIQILAAAPNTRYLGYAYGRAGQRSEAEKLASLSPGALQQVLIYAGLGDKDRTFAALDRMTELGPVRVGRTLTFPELMLLRGDPRLRALRKKVGLPE